MNRRQIFGRSSALAEYAAPLRESLGPEQEMASPLPPPGLAGWALPVILATMLVTAIALLAVVRSPAVQLARGELLPVSGMIEVRAPRAGRVREIREVEGATVTTGFTLFILDTDQPIDRSTTLTTQELENARRARDSLAEELRQQHELSQSRVAELEARLSAGTSALVRTRTERDLQLARTRLAQESVVAARQLHARGLFSSLGLRQREEIALQMRQAELQLEGRISELELTQTSLRAQLAQLRPEAALVTLDLERRKADQETRIAQLTAGAEAVVTSPRSGRLSTVRVRTGQSVAPGELLATLLPAEETLQAELWVPSAAVGRMKVGDPVRLMYDAFPYDRYGLHEATVVALDSTPLPPELLPAGLSTNEPMYKVIAQLPRQDLHDGRQPFALQPGLRFQAHIVLEQRSALQWLFSPLIRAVERGTAK